jgi:hypothetical protein
LITLGTCSTRQGFETGSNEEPTFRSRYAAT